MFSFFKTRPGPFMGPQSEFKKLRNMVLLWIVSQSSTEGITGYELQSAYNIPQTNAYRILKEMKDEDLVDIDEKIVDGRAQKRYIVTETGREQLQELMKDAASKVGFLLEMMAAGSQKDHFQSFLSGERRLRFLKNQVINAGTKEKVLELLNGVVTFMDHEKEMFSKVLANIDANKPKIEKLIEHVSGMEEFDPASILEFIDREARPRQEN